MRNATHPAALSDKRYSPSGFAAVAYVELIQENWLECKYRCSPEHLVVPSRCCEIRVWSGRSMNLGAGDWII